MAKVKYILLLALTCVRNGETMVMPGKKFEVEEKQAEALIKLKAAKLVEDDDDVIEGELVGDDETLATIAGIVSEEQKEALKAAGFEDLESFKDATKATLTAVEGVGDATADKILKALEA